MPFERLSESFYDHEITLPVGEHEYTIPSPDADTGVFVQRVVVIGATAANNEPLTDDDKKFLADAPSMTSDEFIDAVLTPEVHAQIKADKLNWGAYQKIVGTAMQWVAFGREAAEAHWNAKEGEQGPNPQAPQDHRSPSKPASAPRSRGTAKKTPSKRSGNPAKRAAGSAGSTSSATGRTSRRTSSSSTASASGTRTTTKKSPGTTSDPASSNS